MQLLQNPRAYTGISLSFGVAGRHCHEPGQIHCFIVHSMDQFIKVAGTEGKVGGYFCRLPPLNENTDIPVSNINKHLALDSILADCQHGFRSQRSCETHLVQFVHDLISNLDGGIMGL